MKNAKKTGVAFIGGEGPDPERCRELAESASLVAAADSGLMTAENAGIIPDWITGDMDSLDSMERLGKYPPERILRYPADKDYTDTELVLELLWDKGCDEVWLAGGGGGRLDHILAIRSLFEREKAPCRWYTAGEAVYLVEGNLSFEAEPERAVSVFPAGEGPWKIGSQGLKWPLDDLVWTRGFFGISNSAPDGNFRLSVKKGRFLVLISNRPV